MQNLTSSIETTETTETTVKIKPVISDAILKSEVKNAYELLIPEKKGTTDVETAEILRQLTAKILLGVVKDYGTNGLSKNQFNWVFDCKKDTSGTPLKNELINIKYSDFKRNFYVVKNGRNFKANFTDNICMMQAVTGDSQSFSASLFKLALVGPEKILTSKGFEILANAPKDFIADFKDNRQNKITALVNKAIQSESEFNKVSNDFGKHKINTTIHRIAVKRASNMVIAD